MKIKPDKNIVLEQRWNNPKKNSTQTLTDISMGAVAVNLGFWDVTQDGNLVKENNRIKTPKCNFKKPPHA